jgi:cellulose synthase/poly-beta-1,6-N-acetylglucosamine synthase-like glycosyltransferase
MSSPGAPDFRIARTKVRTSVDGREKAHGVTSSRSSRALVGIGLACSLVNLYLLTLLVAAAVSRRRSPSSTLPHATRFAVVIPAHNEAAAIEPAILSVASIEYPAEAVELIVIADNCSDETADVARSLGATVWERTDPDSPGKGAALAWGLARILAERLRIDAVAVVDADCEVSPNFLSAIEKRLLEGANAVQVNYVVSNPRESTASALRYAAFALITTVRPLGKTTLGLSCGLLGTGMAFTRTLLERHPWRAYSLGEDHEQHARLVAAGERVVFAAEASVRSRMPTSLEATRDQQLRWESGRWHLITSMTRKLLAQGIRGRDPACFHTALEPLVPPQSLLVLMSLSVTVAAAALRARGAFRLGLANLAAQASLVVGSLVFVRAPRAVYRALLAAPALVVMKLLVYLRIAVGKGPREWVRTEREA